MLKHTAFILTCIVLCLVLIVPIPTPMVHTEENPNDEKSILLSQNNSVSVRAEHISTKTSSIAIWTGDTIATPLSTILTIQINDTPTQHIPLGKALSEERKITIPISKLSTNSLDITVSAPSLDEKKALVVRTQRDNKGVVAYTLFENKPLIIALLNTFYTNDPAGDDIEYVWKEGIRILQGGNPYKKAESSPHLASKYATYLPLSYIVSASIAKAGYASFSSWLTIMRPILLSSQLLTAVLVLWFLYKKDKLIVGIFGFFLILFHRFTLYPAHISQIDFPAIMSLVVGIYILPKKPKTGYILIGASLAIKQMAVIALPIFLIWEYRKQRSIPSTARALALMFLVPIITLLPFIIDSPKGVGNSLAFSANRPAGGDFGSQSITSTLSLTGFASRIGMYILLAIVFAAFWKREIGLWGACLAIFTIFIGFNPVLFFQYLAWIIPFIPLAISEVTFLDTPSQSSHQLRDT